MDTGHPADIVERVALRFRQNPPSAAADASAAAGQLTDPKAT